MRHTIVIYLASMVPALLLCAGASEAPRTETRNQAPPPGFRGTHFLAFTNLASFTATNELSGERVWTSPVIETEITWDELVLSWNVETLPDVRLVFEVRALDEVRASVFYNLGRWSPPGSPKPRESVRGQNDEFARVDTDTLQLHRPASRFQLRVRAEGEFDASQMKLLGISLRNGKTRPPTLPALKRAWGKVLEVPEISQMAYPNGGVLCSPATVSMLLSYWANQRDNCGWRQDVPEIASGVYDRNWKGTGNWSFNVAFAGSLPGMRGYVSRLTDISELEELVAAGVPIGLSVCYTKLRGKAGEPSGHLVVCTGFTREGNVIINDPGTSEGVRKTFPRSALASAWTHSGNTVYLIYPSDFKLPPSRFEHWLP
jgi:hypothetical protein